MTGILLKNAPLKAYSSWQAGGLANQIYKPANREDLQIFLRQLPENEPVLWLGLGSNTLVRDGGFPGTVIVTQGRLMGLTQVEPLVVKVEAGVACATFARFCARQSLAGVEFLAGVPGTMGGALRMNAGCFNGQTWDHVLFVESIDRQGNITIETPEDFSIAYRHVERMGEKWFLSGSFKLQSGDKATSLNRIKALLERRAKTQPTNEPNCGSVFRNPPNDFAARLIEQSGLKGYKMGGAQVSVKHANFIINDGSAKALDIEMLIDYVQQQVHEKMGVFLTREVHIIGKSPLMY
jgi:UDP-N-acetylmuramate dehydrogenase